MSPDEDDRRSAEDYSLFVTNLPIELNEDGIEKIFKQYGKIKGIMARSEGQFAFVSYGTYAEAENAISSLDGQPPLNLRVQFRKKIVDAPRDDSPHTPVTFHPLNDVVLSRREISTPRSDYIQRDVQLIDCRANGSRLDALRARIPQNRYHNDFNPPGFQSQLIYSPYNEIEYAETNALWSRGCMTVDAAGRRHVTMGRGHTFYHIPEPHPRIIEDIGKVYEKRHVRYYEIGSDQCQQHIGKCLYCSKNATLCCAFCDGFYCTRDCQIADWSKHQDLCKKIPPLVNANFSREFLNENPSNRSDVNVVSQVSSTTPAPRQQQEVIVEKQQVLRRPRETIIVPAEKNNNIVINEKKEVSSPPVNAQESAASSSHSVIQENGRVKTVHDDVFQFKRVDKIYEDSAKNFLSLQKFTDVIITATKEPRNLFFVQKIEDSDKITQLMEEINEKFLTYSTVQVPVIRKTYGVVYEGIWHRGCVVSLNPLIVDYLDYGTIAEVDGQTDLKDIGSLADIPRYSRLIKVPDNMKARNLGSESVISVRMLDIIIDSIDGDEIINVEVSPEQQSTSEFIINNNNNEITSPPSILNFSTLGMTAIAEVCDKIDENTARIVLNFDNVKEMFDLLLDPLAADCEEILSKYPNYVPSIHEFVCMRKPGDSYWYRGCVLNIVAENHSIGAIEIASLDEGVIINQADKIVPLLPKYSDVCIFAATMKSENVGLKSVLEPGNVVELQITAIDGSGVKNSINRVEATLTASGVTAEVKLYQWTPWRSDAPVSKDTIIQKEAPQSPAAEQTVMNKKKSINRLELKTNTKVVIQSYRSPSVVFLRSFETDEVERNNQLIQNVARSAQISPCLKSLPEIGDYVVAQYVDENFYRAMVLTVEYDEKKIKIVYIDYGNMEVTTLDKLRAMPESLMNEPCCTRKVMLKGIKSVPSTKEAVNYLGLLVAAEEQLICEIDGSLDKGGAVILKTVSGSSVNEEINKLLTPSWEKENHENEVTSTSVNSEIMKQAETITNSLEAKILSLGDIENGNLGKIGDTVPAFFLDTLKPGVKYVFAPVDEEMIAHIINVMPDMMKTYCESTDHYIPHENELCIAFYEDNWYRGCCFQSHVSPNSSSIYFIDFGNVATVLHKNIRMMTSDFLKPAAMGCVCIVNGFSGSSEAEPSQISSRLQSLLIANETYNVEIVSFDEEEYIIKLPEIHSKLVEEGLLPKAI